MTKPSELTKYDNTKHVFQVYEMSRSGMSERAMAEALGVNRMTFRLWRERHPMFQEAIKKGQKAIAPNGKISFQDYVYKQLPEHIQKVWDQLSAIEAFAKGGPTAPHIERVLGPHGVNVRKYLFIHALVQSNFNPSEACKRLNIKRETFVTWAKEKDFRQLMDEIMWHKKNFFEGALVAAVERGETSAILFVNKTLNRDRGYGEKIDVSHEHTHEVNVNMIRVDELNLPLETRKKILDAMRAKKMDVTPALPAHEDVIDAEIVSKPQEEEVWEYKEDDE
jgi:hypothetical protein